jgi:hypothetical protein
MERNPYTLQAGLKLVNDHAVPEYKADQHVFVWPQSSSLNNCCRPSTVVYGTAPYMAGKGAPHDLIELDDSLRPQNTSFFKKYYDQKPYDFPSKDVSCKLPQRTLSFDPANTRGELQNGLFLQRYCRRS